MFKRYKPFFRAGAMDCFAYKFQILMWAIISVLEVGCLVFLWQGVYNNSTSNIINGFTFPQMITYVVFANILNFALLAGVTFNTVSDEIQQGTIAMSFTKPISYRAKLAFSMLGSVCAQMLFIGLPSMIIAYTVLAILGYVQFVSVWSLLLSVVLFVVSLAIASLIYDCIDYICGVCCFYTTASWGLYQLKQVVIAFLSGSLLPLSFFPKTFGKILSYSPFAGLAQNPVLILMGGMDFLSALKCIGLSLGWWILLELLGKLLFNSASKKVTVQGG